MYIRVAPTPTFDRACTFCPSPPSGYKCWDYRHVPAYVKCCSLESPNNILLSVSTIFVCAWLDVSSVFDLFCDPGIWTQGCTQARQIICCRNHTPRSFFGFYFEDECYQHCCKKMSESPVVELLDLQLEAELLDQRKSPWNAFSSCHAVHRVDVPF